MHKYTVVKNPIKRVYEILKGGDESFYEQCAIDIVESVKREKEKGESGYQDIWIPNNKIKELLKVVYKLHAFLPDDSVFVINDYKNNICSILVEWNMSIKKVVTKNKKINIFKSLFRPRAA
jgi:hypothetical protein